MLRAAIGDLFRSSEEVVKWRCNIPLSQFNLVQLFANYLGLFFFSFGRRIRVSQHASRLKNFHHSNNMNRHIGTSGDLLKACLYR